TSHYTLSLHDALPILQVFLQKGHHNHKEHQGITKCTKFNQCGEYIVPFVKNLVPFVVKKRLCRNRKRYLTKRSSRSFGNGHWRSDRKSTRLNSSHVKI